VSEPGRGIHEDEEVNIQVVLLYPAFDRVEYR
jgi:hypothetical protein